MASEGSAKVSLILELKNRMTSSLSRAKENVNKSIGDIKARLANLKQSHMEAFSAMKNEVPGLGGAMSLLSNPYTAAAAGVVALGAAYGKCVNMALDWNKGMAEVNVTAGLSTTELKKLSDQLLEIGTRNVAPIEEIPQAFNKIISAGLDTDAALKLLEPTLRASKAGFTDLEVTAKAAVAVMNSSGREGNEVYDILFATLNKGNAEFKDIAQYLPKIVPTAKAAGFALEETAGAWAFLTAQGQTAERATTLMENAMKSLTDKKKVDAFEKMGVSIYDSSGKMRKLTDIIDDLGAKTKGLSDKERMKFFDKLGLDQEASSFFNVATQGADKLRETIDATTNSQGALEKAYQESKTPMDAWREVVNNIKAEMIRLGDKALPIITKIGEKTLGIVNYFKDLYKNSELFRDTLSGLGIAIEWAMKLAWAPIKAIVNGWIWIGNVIGWVSEKIFGFSGGIEEMYASVKPYLVWIKEMFGQIANIGYKIFTHDFKGAWNAVKDLKLPDINEIQLRLMDERRIKKEAEAKVPQGPIDPDLTDDTPPTPPIPPLPPTPPKDPSKDITTNATQGKNITINIDSFVKGGINTAHTNLQNMDETQLEQWMSNMFMRVIRNAEMGF